ncbi:MAG: adenosylcobalamin-dependent ribonucleoside-diphosphate reductase [Victivallales bacterium]|nr:adenosylcobalamin-dependent ribonucleoside-diphosphate reductase [Victivallales bacterium]
MMTEKLPEYNISKDIWQRKYKFKGNNTLEEDFTVEDTWRRVAKAIAEKEKEPKTREKEFYSILEDFKFLPAGRITANAGTGLDCVTMFNCYVLNDIDDSIEGIFETVKNAALTQKQGGGVGFDFSSIRPKSSSIQGCGAKASGPISFMQVLDATCRTIMSAGQRRGAQMGVMRCDHPDIQEFIKVKQDGESLKMFNLSVGITDEFIEAVKNNDNWELKFNGEVYKTIHASELWDSIMKSTYNYAEPGFILIDRINKLNNLHYCEKIKATNPCGEQPLPPFGACLLGSLNLTRFVKYPFTARAAIDFEKLEKTVGIAVRFLDNVIELSNYPLEAQAEEAVAKRRIGLGITGLADLFIFMKTKYGSRESIELAEDIMEKITNTAYRTSVELAKEKGPFPLFEPEKFLQGEFIRKLPEDIRDSIRKHGIRNSHLTSIAPTGTISILAGNVSSGLEPVFAMHYKRKVRNTTEDDISEFEVTDYAYHEYLKFRRLEVLDDSKLPDYFVTADSVTPEEHLAIQGALQKFVDSSISKTINIPEDYPFEKFKNIYMMAYEKGLKGCTTFRPSEYITGVLVKNKTKKKEEKVEVLARPNQLHGTTYKIKTPIAPDALYITINDVIEDDGTKRPYELFINTKNLQHFSWVVAMTRLISAVFRTQKNPSFLVDELKSIYDPNGGYFSKGKYIPSLAADIGRTIEEHLSSIGLISNSRNVIVKEAHNSESINKKNRMFCPVCNERSLINQENCLKCLSCGYSKCG